MIGEQLVSVAAEGIKATIRPQIGTVAPVASELDVVCMGFRPRLKDANELMLASVEGTHAGVGFSPDAQVKNFKTTLPASADKLEDMSPVHTGEDKRARLTGGSQDLERCP